MSSTRAELEQLASDSYWIRKEWSNEIELRTGKKFRDWLLLLHVLCPVVLFPWFARSVLSNFCGYRYRVFVTVDAD